MFVNTETSDDGRWCPVNTQLFRLDISDVIFLSLKMIGGCSSISFSVSSLLLITVSAPNTLCKLLLVCTVYTALLCQIKLKAKEALVAFDSRRTEVS